MRDTKEAFNWIVNILENKKIRYRITGGCAAKVYGSNRRLADIDIDVPFAEIKKIVPEIRKYLTFPLKRYKDENFDTFGLALKYNGQRIELCAIDKEKLFDSRTKKWVKPAFNMQDYSIKKFLGVRARFIKIKNLIEYKRTLGRGVDLRDIKNLTKS